MTRSRAPLSLPFPSAFALSLSKGFDRLSKNGWVPSAGYLANSMLMSPKAFISSALPEGSVKNMVACSPGSPLKRM